MDKKKREDYSRATKRTAPMGVRFTISDYEEIKKEHGFKTAQALVDFLVSDYKMRKLLGNPVAERNLVPPPKQITHIDHREGQVALRDFTGTPKTNFEINTMSKAVKRPQNADKEPPSKVAPKKQPQNEPQHHTGLTGIDLSIWKSENNEK